MDNAELRQVLDILSKSGQIEGYRAPTIFDAFKDCVSFTIIGAFCGFMAATIIYFY